MTRVVLVAVTDSMPANWFAGWALILTAFLCGAGLGLFFHREDFLGGYASFRRRLTRLGHIALVAIGVLNLLLSLSPVQLNPTWKALASVLLIAGGVAMPAVCFLTAWRAPARFLFPVPVVLLVSAVVCILIGGVT
jgi:hypothetical protein